MSEEEQISPATEATGGHGFSTWPVFIAGISTILGAIMFLRFGFAVGNTGLLGTFLIILLGHLVTIPTALAIAEIATNRRVEGGGEYFIISRSFGISIGSVIGVLLYFSQAISVAFYIIAFAEAFQPVAPYIASFLGMAFDPRMISVPAMLLLALLMFTKGANMGVKALFVVVFTLVISLLLFFLGSPLEGTVSEARSLTSTAANAVPFFVVFSICFPAFTGMTAGVGLSGDLANPRRSIPLGTISATLVGMLMYILIVLKLWYSAPLEVLADNQLVMADIALWGPIIPIGLGAATLSSAIGSILVAPRTLQALAFDDSLPSPTMNKFLSHGIGESNEPRNATVVTSIFAMVIILLGDVNFVASIIAMFFMLTYGALCAISFLEHFAARPSYRPSFRSKWYISLFGAIICVLMMFQMDPVYALISMVLMVVLYYVMQRSRKGSHNDLAEMFHGVMTQATRYMQLRLQFARQRQADSSSWRPAVIMVNDRTFDRRSPIDFMNWLCHRHGFGTYLHFIKDRLDTASIEESEEIEAKLIKRSLERGSVIFTETIISPSMRSALAQSVQLPGVFGMKNNTLMFEFSPHDEPEIVKEIVENCLFINKTKMNRLVLRHSELHFGQRKTIHIWLTWNDQINANLMILIAYMLLGHRDWQGAEITVFAAFPRDEVNERRVAFEQLIATGRIPISEKNIRFLPVNDVESFHQFVEEGSQEADLVMLGFDNNSLEERGKEVFTNHPKLNDVLFVCSYQDIIIE